MRLRIVLLPLLPALFMLSNAWAGGSIRIATPASQPPFNMTLDNGALAGFDVDLVRAMCDAIEARCELIRQDAEALLDGLVQGQYDAVIATLSNLTNEGQDVDSTEYYYASYLSFIAASDSGLTATVDGLAGKRLGAVADSASVHHLQANHATAEIEIFSSTDDALQALKDGKLDAVLANVHEGYNWLAKGDNIGFDYLGAAIDSERRAGIAIRKGDKVLAGKLNDALKALLDNGSFQRIRHNYFPFKIH